MASFALIGAGGFVAPRHMQAIRATGNQLVAAVDKTDSVGILDSYFPEAAFFTEFERFDRHLEKLKRRQEAVEWLSVCSPNYLHDAHARYGLRYGANVICEKPLALNPWNVDALAEIEAETGRRVFTILQLRQHPSVIQLKEWVENSSHTQPFEVELTYITARGPWYYASWKGDASKSGGIATNIGIHFFDMLLWVFGPVKSLEMHQRSHDREAGILHLERASVRWFLSISADTLPQMVREKGGRTYRALHIDGQEFEFSEGFTDLHTESYRRILEGEGWGLSAALPGVRLAHDIRHTSPVKPGELAHPFVHLPVSGHPFQP
ncbi:MAG: Gfo/Idh/MocA family oxidoreductase [Saprospiraceae bacterium]|nr:Gfo/Idh/MocA family oxidoreductase [Saprospiraceae bacterium]